MTITLKEAVEKLRAMAQSVSEVPAHDHKGRTCSLCYPLLLEARITTLANELTELDEDLEEQADRRASQAPPK